MKKLINFFKGMAIAVATLVPGVSGGTMSIVLGVYDELINSISSFFKDWKKHFVFLAQIALGGAIGILLFSRLIESALSKYPFVMRFFFIGVILGSLPLLYKKSISVKRNNKDLMFLLVGLGVSLLMSAEPEGIAALAAAEGMKSIIFLLIAGIIIAVALILPGISASFMLLTLGLYDITLSSINTFNIRFLIPLGIGIVIGTLATVRTLEKLMQRHPGKTYMLIIGFVVGSLIPVFPGIPHGIHIILSTAVFVLGFILIYWLGKKEIN
ncbi:DUF368 domain-containing protein [Clostridium sp. CX1]|uniref:DUF368 domain-containing protein n=1 Tax=Clostridium sp. CX1 TaxID=2978346 RepID=UPI0021C06CEF|nr:DUF368 domain-containing protein [Clostridium sp. CX1]MCT8976940.1 DUF368 domain-containing protein [Clostridium sp. CX1]